MPPHVLGRDLEPLADAGHNGSRLEQCGLLGELLCRLLGELRERAARRVAVAAVAAAIASSIAGDVSESVGSSGESCRPCERGGCSSTSIVSRRPVVGRRGRGL